MKKTSLKTPVSAKKPAPKKAVATKKPVLKSSSTTPKLSVKPKPHKAQGQGELSRLIERLGVIVEQLGQITQQLTETGRQKPREDQALETSSESVADAVAEHREVEAPEQAGRDDATKRD